MGWQTRVRTSYDYSGGGQRQIEEEIRCASGPDDFRGGYYCGRWSILMADNQWYWLETYNCNVDVVAERFGGGVDNILEEAHTIGYTYYIFSGNQISSDDLEQWKTHYQARPMEQSNIDKHRSELGKAVYSAGYTEQGGVQSYY